MTGYRGAADLAAMQAALAAWIQHGGDCGFCHAGDLPHRLYNGLRGRYPLDELVRLWHDADGIGAFAIVYPDQSGYDAFVSPAQRGTDLERHVLDWGYETSRRWMDQEGYAADPVQTDVHTCDETRAALLRDLGYEPEGKPWLAIGERPLGGTLPPVELPEGYTIRAARGEEDDGQLQAVHNAAFDSDWAGDEYLDQVMRQPGYDPALEQVVVAPDGTFAAFCIVWLDAGNKVGLFEPVGTHAAHQRMGLGRAIMAHGLDLMRQRGMQRAQVGWEMDNPASDGLYAALGFEPKHRLTAYGKM
ncbi:MAG: GNAT family N-acetyltransferase [Anaerolineae bacterium]